MTLITVGNSEGNHRCDARCYNATGDVCECCCGGKNHKAGFEQALANTREIAEQILKQFPNAEFDPAVKQLQLL